MERKIGLALGSGAARGWAHIGVLRALAEAGVVPDIICGTSVGALVGAAYLTGQLDELQDWAQGLGMLGVVRLLDVTFSRGGLVAIEKAFERFRNPRTDVPLEKLPKPFAAVATDIATGREIWLRTGHLLDVVRASAAMPGLFPAVPVDGLWLVDGALVNPVPVSACRSLGAEMVIAVNLSADLIGKARRADASIPTAAGFDLLSLLEEAEPPRLSTMNALTRRIFRRDYDGPSLFGVMVSSLGIIQDRISRSRLAGDPPDVHIVPRLGHIGLLEFDRADEVIAAGEEAVERALPELRDALAVFAHGPNGNLREPA